MLKFHGFILKLPTQVVSAFIFLGLNFSYVKTFSAQNFAQSKCPLNLFRNSYTAESIGLTKLVQSIFTYLREKIDPQKLVGNVETTMIDGSSVHIIGNSELARQIGLLTSKESLRGESDKIGKLNFGNIGILNAHAGHSSIFQANGKEWAFLSRMLRQPLLMDSLYQHGNFQTVRATIDKHIEQLKHKLNNKNGGQRNSVVDLSHEISVMTLDSFLRSLFGLELNQSELEMLLFSKSNLFQELGDFFRNPKKSEITGGEIPIRDKESDALVLSFIQRLYNHIHSVSESAQTPLVKTLLKIEDQYGTQHGKEIVINQLNFLLSAGYDATTSSITTTLFFLLRNKAAYHEVKREINDSTPSGDIENGNIQFDKKYPTLSAFFEESMRLHPPVTMFMREILADATITLSNGEKFDFKKGDKAMISVRASNMDNRLTDETPFAFIHERFIRDSEYKKPKSRHFGEGPRVCPGRFFAIHEVSLILSSIIANFNLKIVDPVADNFVTDFSHHLNRPLLVTEE